MDERKPGPSKRVSTRSSDSSGLRDGRSPSAAQPPVQQRLYLDDTVKQITRKRVSRRHFELESVVGVVTSTPWDSGESDSHSSGSDSELHSFFEPSNPALSPLLRSEAADRKTSPLSSQASSPDDRQSHRLRGDTKGSKRGTAVLPDHLASFLTPSPMDFVTVIWFDPRTFTPTKQIREKISTLSIVDRALLSGDIVQRVPLLNNSPHALSSTSSTSSFSSSTISSSTTSTPFLAQEPELLGVVTRVDSSVNLRSAEDNRLIQGVECRLLQRLFFDDLSSLVIPTDPSKRKVGIIVGETMGVHLRFSDKSECILENASHWDLSWASALKPQDIIPNSEYKMWLPGDLIRIEDDGPYEDGVRWLGPEGCYRDAVHLKKWTRLVRFVPGPCLVEWYVDFDSLFINPDLDTLVPREDLVFLDQPWHHEHLQVGEVVRYQDTVCRVHNLSSSVNVLWQDASSSLATPSYLLAPARTLNAFDLIPGDVVTVEDPADLEPPYDAMLISVSLAAGIAQVAPLFAHSSRGPASVPTMACRQQSHWEECRIGSFVLIKPPPDHFRDSLLSLDRDFRDYIGILAGIDTASQTLSVRYPSGLTSPLSPSLDIRVLEYTPESLPLAHFFLHSVAEATAAPTVAGHRNSYPLPHLVNTGTTSSNITHCNNRDASISSSVSSSSTPPSTSTHHPNVADPFIMTELNLEAIHALPQMPESFLLLDTPVFELHHFITAPPSEQVSFLRHLRGEWKVLAELPPSIKLVSWSSRCDLLRAMIVGPPDSFYQDFLFFFDIHLPPTYPQDPPAVFFISRVSERVHPHLYAQGKVCLSLLGTWTAHSACERWIPYRSSLNQVLLSIQGLLLSTNKPYFLEPGFEKQCDTARGEALSHAYNERALVLLAQSTVRMLLHPDPIFQRPAYDHFQPALPTISRRLEDVLSNPDWSQGSKTPLQQINQHLKSLFVKLFP